MMGQMGHGTEVGRVIAGATERSVWSPPSATAFVNEDAVAVVTLADRIDKYWRTSQD